MVVVADGMMSTSYRTDAVDAGLKVEACGWFLARATSRTDTPVSAAMLCCYRNWDEKQSAKERHPSCACCNNTRFASYVR